MCTSLCDILEMLNHLQLALTGISISVFTCCKNARFFRPGEIRPAAVLLIRSIKFAFRKTSRAGHD